MSLTTIRQFLQNELAADLGIEFKAGVIDGPVERRDLGCVWITGTAEDADNIDVEVVNATVRVFKQYVAPAALDNPVDPSPLEALVETIYTALRDKQADQATGAWYFRATGSEIDMESQGVEVPVMCLRANAFV